jgi:hypothetical protein
VKGVLSVYGYVMGCCAAPPELFALISDSITTRECRQIRFVVSIPARPERETDDERGTAFYQFVLLLLHESSLVLISSRFVFNLAADGQAIGMHDNNWLGFGRANGLSQIQTPSGSKTRDTSQGRLYIADVASSQQWSRGGNLGFRSSEHRRKIETFEEKIDDERAYVWRLESTLTWFPTALSVPELVVVCLGMDAWSDAV